jgi:16S rRNA (guanine527-N7)-methyltransferase
LRWSDADPRPVPGSVSEHVLGILRQSDALGFLGPMELEAQINHALGFVSTVDGLRGNQPATVLDLGTGGGIPGLILADSWPSSRIVLLDSNRRKTDFLRSAIARWGRDDRVEVVQDRAEIMGRVSGWRESFDLVTARSFGRPSVAAECGGPLLALGGTMVVSEPPSETGRWPVEGLAPLGLEVGPTVRSVSNFNYQVLIKAAPTDDRFPRRVGVPTKRPLF